MLKHPLRLTLFSLLLTALTACSAAPAALPPRPIPSAVAASPTPFVPASDTPQPPTPLLPSPSPTLPPSSTPTPEPPTLTPTASPLPRASLLFTGVIVPARCVQSAIDERGSADYIFDGVRDLIQQADLAIGVFNATMSDYPPRTGCVRTYVLVGGSSNADALAAAGFDVMNVATNHIKNCGLGDCGDRAFLDTLDNLNRVGILSVGAADNLVNALLPVVVPINGVRFGFVALGMVEPMAFAGPDTPGIAVLNEDNLRAAIAAARQVSDVVIAMPHWGPEDTPNPNSYQLDYARIAVEAGADVVVGNHTHVVQAIQEIDGVTVFYGLGNFVFDQNWDLAHQQGVILRLNFEGSRYLGYELIPTHVEGNGTVTIAAESEAAEILARIQTASDKLK